MIFNFFYEMKQTEEGERQTDRQHEPWDPNLAAPENHLEIFKYSTVSFSCKFVVTKYRYD